MSDALKFELRWYSGLYYLLVIGIIRAWIIHGPRPTHTTLTLRWSEEAAHEEGEELC
jgi:hypothetical protein